MVDFWLGLAITIMVGLTFGTFLTMLIAPALYKIFLKLREFQHTTKGQTLYIKISGLEFLFGIIKKLFKKASISTSPEDDSQLRLKLNVSNR